MDCLFCRLYQARVAPHSFETHFWWLLDIHPVSPGHTLIISKRHVARLDELSPEEEANLRCARMKVVDFIDSDRGQRLRGLYEHMIRAPETPNSPWFARRALVHPRFGTKPDGYNHATNEGDAAGQEVKHLHWHVMPRYKGDVEDPRGGVRYVIPAMGNYMTSRESSG